MTYGPQGGVLVPAEVLATLRVMRSAGMGNDEEVMTRQEVADLLKYERKKIAEMEANHGLPSVDMPGREARYFRSEIIAWMKLGANVEAGQRVVARRDPEAFGDKRTA